MFLKACKKFRKPGKNFERQVATLIEKIDKFRVLKRILKKLLTSSLFFQINNLY